MNAMQPIPGHDDVLLVFLSQVCSALESNESGNHSLQGCFILPKRTRLCKNHEDTGKQPFTYS